MSQGKEEECGRGGEGGGCNLSFLLGVSDDNSKVMHSHLQVLCTARFLVLA